MKSIVRAAIAKLGQKGEINPQCLFCVYEPFAKIWCVKRSQLPHPKPQVLSDALEQWMSHLIDSIAAKKSIVNCRDG